MSIAFSEFGQHCMIPEAAFFGVRNNIVILRFDDCGSRLLGVEALLKEESVALLTLLHSQLWSRVSQIR
jgi:hypothetical protein